MHTDDCGAFSTHILATCVFHATKSRHESTPVETDFTRAVEVKLWDGPSESLPCLIVSVVSVLLLHGHSLGPFRQLQLQFSLPTILTVQCKECETWYIRHCNLSSHSQLKTALPSSSAIVGA